MAKRYEIRFSGSGGQGLILAGVIMAEAASIFDGKNAVQSQSYGPESRGGASKSEVIISDGDINYPKAMDIDALLSLTQESCLKYYHDLKDEGILVVDSDLVKELPKGNFKVFSLPIISTAVNKIGKSMVANIVALGAMAAITKVVSYQALESAVLARVPKGTEELNKKALKSGYELLETVKNN